KLLIVDDHAGVRQLVRQLVALPGDEIRECASGEEAVSVALSFQPEFVTMDVRLPGMCGLEATRALRQSVPQARIVIVSSHQHDELRRQVQQAGAAAFVAKDDLQQLREILRKQNFAQEPRQPFGLESYEPD